MSRPPTGSGKVRHTNSQGSTSVDDVVETEVVNYAALTQVAGTGPTGAAHNRNINDASTTHPGTDATNTATWTTAEGVTELTINSINSSGTGSALQNDEGYLVVINAPTAVIAKSWLEDVGAVGQDVQYIGGITASDSLVIRRTTTITRADVLPIGIDQRFVIGGV